MRTRSRTRAHNAKIVIFRLRAMLCKSRYPHGWAATNRDNGFRKQWSMWIRSDDGIRHIHLSNHHTRIRAALDTGAIHCHLRIEGQPCRPANLAIRNMRVVLFSSMWTSNTCVSVSSQPVRQHHTELRDFSLLFVYHCLAFKRLLS